MLHIAIAEQADIPLWLTLAAEVEPLFGPMVADPAFHAALERVIARGTAFCVREGAGPAGTPLMGALLFSNKRAPYYTVHWLAVAARWQRHGVARALMEQCIGLIQSPAELSVMTFGADTLAGQPARHFYERMGFVAAETAPRGPEGGSRQVFRRVFPASEHASAGI